jgi:hypothetical protein
MSSSRSVLIILLAVAGFASMVAGGSMIAFGLSHWPGGRVQIGFDDGKPARAEFDGDTPVGLYFMTRFWSGTGSLEKSAWYFAPDGSVYRDLSRGVSQKDLEEHKGGRGTVSVDGETMTITWSDAKTSTSKIERDGETFTWDMGIFSPVKPFDDESDLAGRWEGGESLSGGAGRAMMAKTLELRSDGTFTWSSVSFLTSEGSRTTVSAGAQGGTSGKWDLDDYTLTLTSDDGKTYSGVAFPYHDGSKPRVFFNGILYKEVGQ